MKKVKNTVEGMSLDEDVHVPLHIKRGSLGVPTFGMHKDWWIILCNEL